MIYLDNAATSYYKPLEVKQAVNIAVNLYTANAGRGAHKLAQLSAEKIYDVRQKVLDFFDANQHECIFTSGCTSALNLAILGTAKSGGHVITTYLEHNSVLRPLEHLKSINKIDYTVVDDLSIKTFENATGVNIPYNIVDRRPGDIATCYADPKKAENELGWKAEKTLEQMCKDCWN